MIGSRVRDKNLQPSIKIKQKRLRDVGTIAKSTGEPRITVSLWLFALM